MRREKEELRTWKWIKPVEVHRQQRALIGAERLIFYEGPTYICVESSFDEEPGGHQGPEHGGR